jgi:signal transduction histidine kinase
MADITAALFIVMLANLALAGVVWFSHARRSVRASYALVAVGVSLWALGNSLFQSADMQTALVWARLCDAAALMIVLAFLYFAHVFPSGRISTRFTVLFVLLTTIFITASLVPNTFISSVGQGVAGRALVRHFPAVYLFAAVVGGGFLWAFWVLGQKLRFAAEVERAQVAIVLVGAGIATALGVVMNLILPMLGNYTLVWLGPDMTSILLVASMYAITKHRLFESRVMLSELLAILLFLGALYLTLRFPSPPYVYYQAVYLTLTIAVGILFLRSVNKEVIATDRLQEANEQLEGRNRRLAALTENLEQANQSLKELMEIKTEFLHIASHQLRTPLTSMRGLLEMQAKGDLERLPVEQRRQMQRDMLTSANKLNNIVNDLLDAMELEGGTLNFRFAPVQLEDLVEDVIKMLKLNYDRKGLFLTFQHPATPLPQVEADDRFLREALMNMVDNAEKYTPHGGVTIKVEAKDDTMELSVTDTGIGIDPEEAQELFGKFVRGRRSSAIHTDGSGLGLYIIKRIIEGHHGQIRLDSPGIDKGTTVHVTLPLKQTRTQDENVVPFKT